MDRLHELIRDLAPAGVLRDPGSALMLLGALADGSVDAAEAEAAQDLLEVLTPEDLAAVRACVEQEARLADDVPGLDPDGLLLEGLRAAASVARDIGCEDLASAIESGLVGAPAPSASRGSTVTLLPKWQDGGAPTLEVWWHAAPWAVDVSLDGELLQWASPAMRAQGPDGSSVSAYAWIEGALWVTEGADGLTRQRAGEAVEHTFSGGSRVAPMLVEREVAPDWLAAVALDTAEHLVDLEDPLPELEGGRERETRAALLARALATQPFYGLIEQAGRAYETGEALSQEGEAAAADLIRTRLLLEHAAMSFEDADALLLALAEADLALKSAGAESAVLFLTDEEYDRATEGLHVPGTGWLGARARLDAAELPEVMWDRDLLAEARWVANVEAVSHAQPPVAAAPVPWAPIPPALEPVRRVAHAKSPEPQPLLRERAGVVDLLLVDGDEGVCATLEVRHAPGGGLWAPSLKVDASAVRAVRDAFAAVQSLCPYRLAPHPLSDHEIRIGSESESPAPEGQTWGFDLLSGDSLGLPFTLALASLWTGTVVAPGLAASGGVSRDGRIGDVGGLEEKLDALLAARAEPRVFVAPGQIADDVEVGVTEVKEVRDLFAELSLDLSSLEPIQSVRNRRARVRALDHLVDMVECQELPAGLRVANLSPWIELADQVMASVESLVDEPGLDEVVWRGRYAAALAYMHGGALSDAFGVFLQPLERKEEAIAPTALLARLEEAELSTALRADIAGALLTANIDQALAEGGDAWDRGRPLFAACDELVGALGPEYRTIQARVRGSQGRWLMHQGRPADALAYLAESVDSHRLADPVEIPRSRIYLAMALRHLGRYGEATETLETASGELEPGRWRGDESYRISTRMYLDYEVARLALESGDYSRAWAHALAAYRPSRQSGPWPRAGILRTMVWLAGVGGLDAGRARALDELTTLVDRTGGVAASPFRIFLEEAKGEPTRDGVVY